MKRKIALGIVLLGLAACRSDQHRSAVGEWEVADDSVLAQDRITISFRTVTNDEFAETLSYSLQPSGLMTIERGRDHEVCCFGDHRYLVDHRWLARLSHDQQVTIRRKLARLRPRALAKDYPFVLPAGCTFATDTPGWASVIYVQGAVGGAFVFQPACTGQGADSVERLLQEIVAALPHASEADDFVRRSS